MFRVIFKSISAVYKGCPEKGLPAIDWRLARGLDGKPDNCIERIDFERHSEEICRFFSSRLEDSADLFLSTDHLEYPAEIVKNLEKAAKTPYMVGQSQKMNG